MDILLLNNGKFLGFKVVRLEIGIVFRRLRERLCFFEGFCEVFIG